MYKNHLLTNLEREIILLKQIAPLIEERDLQFRPTEKVRSTYELMQYLSGLSGTMLRWLIKNDLTPEIRKEIADYRSTLTIENFSGRLDEQLEIVQKFIADITDEQLLTMEVELPWKEKMPLGAAIINAPIKWMATYRMELFLYLKMNGRPDLSTKEAWIPQEIQIPA